MERKCLLALAIMVMLATTRQEVCAQNADQETYKMGIGIKGWPFAVDFKAFVGQNNRAIELLGYFEDGFRLTGLYEFHGDLTASESLKWYIGIGAHGGYYDAEGIDGITAGFDGTVGLDYKFRNVPIAMALDWQPSVELVTPKTEFQPGRGGFAVRFAF